MSEKIKIEQDKEGFLIKKCTYIPETIKRKFEENNDVKVGSYTCSICGYNETYGGEFVSCNYKKIKEVKINE